MLSVDEQIEKILKAEGGVSNDPDDPGGVTNHGVSLRYARHKGLDLNGDGVVDGKDILMVTPEMASELFKRDFYFLPHIDRLPKELQPVLFDAAVNEGAAGAIMVLQKALNDMGYDLKEDGACGPATCKAVEEACAMRGWRAVNNKIIEQRIAHYNQIVYSRPSQMKYLKGWVGRAKSFIA